ncbi:hypothetical protein C8Q80DRAFT_267062 [Daedaleopsis nitida]|nr:hypothetical protein C8Q80DRAFT_267062 [Daedaleopsis nitida]
MYSRALPLAFVALFAGQVAANTHAVRSTLSVLLARQSTGIVPEDIPEACRSQCSPAINTANRWIPLSAPALQACTDVDCLCNSTLQGQLVSCLDCALAQGNSDDSLQAQAQDSIDQYEDACKAAGITLNHANLPKNGNGAGSVALSSGAVVGAVGVAVAALVL